MRKWIRVASVFVPAALLTGALIYGQQKMGPINPILLITNGIEGSGGSGFVTVYPGGSTAGYAFAVQNYLNTINFLTIDSAGNVQSNNALVAAGTFRASTAPVYLYQSLATAATIAPTTAVVNLTGTTTITTITVPTNVGTTYSTVIYFLPASAVSFSSTGGNIYATVSATAGGSYIAIYDQVAAKWKIAAA